MNNEYVNTSIVNGYFYPPRNSVGKLLFSMPIYNLPPPTFQLFVPKNARDKILPRSQTMAMSQNSCGCGTPIPTDDFTQNFFNKFNLVVNDYDTNIPFDIYLKK